MGRYAEKTEVTADRSRAEIERTLVRYGARGFGYMWQVGERGDMQSVIMFEMQERRIKFVLSMARREQFERTPGGQLRTSRATIDTAWEQAQRQRWRALLLVIKAKLEAIEAGITDFESEFLAATMLPRGVTVGEWAREQVRWSYESGEMPPLLPGVPPDRLALPAAQIREVGDGE